MKTKAKKDSVVKALVAFGFEVEERETTRGAKKAWLKATGSDAVSAFEKALRVCEMCGFRFWSVDREAQEARNDDFMMEAYDDGSGRRDRTRIFVAEYRRTRSGVEYAEGIDC